jgi:hypothetical protein
MPCPRGTCNSVRLSQVCSLSTTRSIPTSDPHPASSPSTTQSDNYGVGQSYRGTASPILLRAPWRSANADGCFSASQLQAGRCPSGSRSLARASRGRGDRASGSGVGTTPRVVPWACLRARFASRARESRKTAGELLGGTRRVYAHGTLSAYSEGVVSYARLSLQLVTRTGKRGLASR